MKETNYYSLYLDVPFDVTRHSLYNAGELYKGYEPAADDEDIKIAKPAKSEAPAENGRPELKRERHDKFDKLQFGDNYDVE